MFETLKNAFKVKEIRKKIWMTLLLLLVFRIGCYIPVPGLERAAFEEAILGNQFLQIMSSITGGSLANGTLFALGIGPYINASIIVQLLCFGIPALERLSKEGEDGRRKISQITRYVAIVLAIVQAIGIIVNFAINQNAVQSVLFGSGIWGTPASNWIAGIYMTIVYTAGSCLVMWLGDRITEYGV
ncbi:MAG: preprotein translocase subunit SecY, partial [Clostridia bacterium]|nr:preprotein translocase subunit SecY [Clostridia bacterium]